MATRDRGPTLTSRTNRSVSMVSTIQSTAYATSAICTSVNGSGRNHDRKSG